MQLLEYCKQDIATGQIVTETFLPEDLSPGDKFTSQLLALGLLNRWNAINPLCKFWMKY